ncbi:MAG: gas vesicle protein [Candidatus Rokubacteria bacterium]|nr:gas vesicle protein [Candidatus Rokubacteria bacterium]
MSRPPRLPPATEIIEDADASLLDLIDNLLNKGVVLNGEVVLSLASIDLVYLRLSVLLCAADRVFPQARRRRKTRPRVRGAPRPGRA